MLVLRPAERVNSDRARSIDACGRLQLRCADVEIIGSLEILIAVTVDGELVLGAAEHLAQVAVEILWNPAVAR